MTQARLALDWPRSSPILHSGTDKSTSNRGIQIDKESNLVHSMSSLNESALVLGPGPGE